MTDILAKVQSISNKVDEREAYLGLTTEQKEFFAFFSALQFSCCFKNNMLVIFQVN